MNLDINVLLSTTATMLILICVGYGSAKAGLLNVAFSKKLSTLIINICQPALLVSSLLDVEYSRQNLIKGGSIVLLSACVHLINIIIAVGSSYALRDRKERTVHTYATTFSNCAFFGFPVLRSVFGPEGVFWGAFYCVIFNILVWTWGMFVLSRSNKSIKMSLRKTFINLGTVPCLIGIILYITRFFDRIPSVISTPVTSGLSYLSGLCTPISMLIIGALLARLPVKKVFFMPSAYYFCFIKLLVLPSFVVLIGMLAGLDKTMICFAALMAGFPTAATGSAFSERYDIAPEFSSVCVGLSTVLSVATVPLIVSVIDRLL